MSEHNKNAFRVESDDEPASRSLAEPAPGPVCDASHPLAEYNSQTGNFVIDAPAVDLSAALSAESSADLSAALSAEALAEAEASAKAEASSCGALAEQDADFEPVPIRARHDGWTPERQRQFLVELADCGIVKEAAARVGMSEKAAGQLRHRAEGTPFHDAWDRALEAGMGRIHSVAFERAIEGVPKPIFYGGKQVGEQRLYDNRLLLALLAKAGQPFDSLRASRVHDRWEDYLEAVENGWSRPRTRLEDSDDAWIWKDDDGTWWTFFPPPDGCEVSEQGEYGDDDYRRTLTPAELEAVQAMHDRRRERECAERDRFFGLEK